MKGLHILIAAKLVALAGAGGFLYAEHQSKAQAQESAPDQSGAKSTDIKSDEIPVIPEKGLSLSRAAEIRNQLLLMRRDVEKRIAQLQAAKQGYDRSKSSVEAKLKRIEEERRLLEETLQKERKAKQERLSDALQFVAKMEPQKAAPLLESMDRDLVMQLLKQLPPRQVTKLLESVNPKKATEFLEYYTRIRSGREYELLREMGLCASGNEGEFDEKPNDAQGQPSGQANPSGQGAESARPTEQASTDGANSKPEQGPKPAEEQVGEGEQPGKMAAKSNEPSQEVGGKSEPQKPATETGPTLR